ncbi:MAG: Rrf2 family transcriptional regulator, partial [Longimicrobiales bacterium]
MVSQTGIYALQAVLLLARTDGSQPRSAAAIAGELDLPANYLAKTLRRLRVEGVVSSSRGAHGGYRLAVAPSALSLARVLEPFEELRPGRTCLMGGTCDPDDPCSAHARWSSVTASAREMLDTTTVA